MEQVWDKVLSEIKTQISEKYFQPFIEPLMFIKNENGIVFIKAPSISVKTHVENKYQEYLQVAIEKITGIKSEIQIEVDSNENPISNFLQNKFQEEDFSFNPNYTFANFIKCNTNEQAFFSANEVANDLSTSNPIYIYGKVGVGKTHLLHAIGNAISIRFPNKKVKYISMADFLSEYVFSVQTRQGIEAFRLKYQTYNILLVDDVQTLTSGAEKTQDEFLLLFNFLFDRKRKIIIVGDKPINELSLNEKLKSRLFQGYQTEIKSPSQELISKIIKFHSKELGLHLTKESIDFISKNFSDDIRSTLGCLNDLCLYKKAYSLLLLDPELVIEILESRIKRNKDFKQSEEKILDYIAEKYSQSKKDILSKSRKAEFIIPRHVTMFILHEVLGLNKTVIGRMFSTKHTTVISAIARIKKLMLTDAKLKREINSIQSEFGLH